MRDSSERIQSIADYLSSYKTKIEALNKNGLFDTATLYELFAAEICKLWFGQDFTNLNTVRANYPYVDLVSKDGTTYADKLFINSLWEKYGQYHLIGLLTAIYEMQIDQLLPEVLPSVSVSLRKAKEDSADFIEIAINQSGTIINEIITTAYVEKEDQIKQSHILTAAFESLLELLVDYGIEIAAVILDEFRIH